MSTIRIKRDATIHALETGLASLEAGTNLQLPINTGTRYIGTEAALFQFIITWSIRSGGQLITHVQANDDPRVQLNRFTNRAYGLLAVMMASNILTSDRRTSLNKVARDCAAERLRKIWLGPKAARRGMRVFLMCVDHDPSANSPPALYSSEGSVRGARDFEELARTILQDIMTRRQATPFRSSVVPLGRVLLELFDNTDRWGRTSWSGAERRRSVRGILAEHHSDTAQAFLKTAKDDLTLMRYVQNLLRERPNATPHFLEISIFDSGAGLAARITETETTSLSLEGEYAACIDCLKRRRSSSKIPGEGYGLFRVMNELSRLQALLRIRSGRLCLYRDFVQRPFLTSESLDAYVTDWSGEQRVIELPSVEGTLYTLLFPLGT